MNGFPVVILIVFPFFFAGVWILVMRLLSFVSGWHRLAERYHHPEEFRGTVLRNQSARLRGVNFNRVLDIGAGEEGLYLVPMILFRLFHKPLLIPWGEIEAEPFRRFLSGGVRLTFRSVHGVPLELSRRAHERIMERRGG
jgi:hypothetical protein